MDQDTDRPAPADEEPDRDAVAGGPPAEAPQEPDLADTSDRQDDPPAADSEGAATEPPSPTSRRFNLKIGSQKEGSSTTTEVRAKPQELTRGPQDTTADADTADPPAKQLPPPRVQPRMSEDLQKELDDALGDASIDQLLNSPTAAAHDELEEGAAVTGQVLSIRNENIFVELGQRHQGIVSTRQCRELPAMGSTIEAVVRRFDASEGLYELVLPDAAVDVGGWEELSEGMVVAAVVTGHNKGGLQVEINRLRGFVPLSQVALHRVEALDEYVGQRLDCVVTEVNAQKRNLVLSRRAILERERAEAKQKLLAELEVGQTREGIVSRLQPFGAFVDLGGIDGLVHISQISWDRVAHPNEVLKEGQKIKVRIEKINQETGKIALAYRDTFENPWTRVAEKYQPKSTIRGTVTRLMDFGAFVRLEPGVEGLIHISELAHRRVFRTADVLSDGQEVEVLILSVDPDAQRISLSLKALEAPPERADKKRDAADEDLPVTSPPIKKHGSEKLRGGTNRGTGGDQFGLKW